LLVIADPPASATEADRQEDRGSCGDLECPAVADKPEAAHPIRADRPNRLVGDPGRDVAGKDHPEVRRQAWPDSLGRDQSAEEPGRVATPVERARVDDRE
jgi:hypothetical protein